MKTHPLRFIALLAFLFLASVVARAAQAEEKYTFVLVHGATAGGWVSTPSGTMVMSS